MHGFACRSSLPQISRWRLLLAMTAVAALCVLAMAAPARADSVTDWDQIAAAALQSPGTATPPGAGQGAPSIVHLAMVHAAVYDAVNAIEGGHEPYVSSPVAEPSYSQDAAVAAAARHVLVNGGLGIPAARWPRSRPPTRLRSTRSRPGRRRPAASPPARSPRARCWRHAPATAASGRSALPSARCRASGGRPPASTTPWHG